MCLSTFEPPFPENCSNIGFISILQNKQGRCRSDYLFSPAEFSHLTAWNVSICLHCGVLRIQVSSTRIKTSLFCWPFCLPPLKNLRDRLWIELYKSTEMYIFLGVGWLRFSACKQASTYCNNFSSRFKALYLQYVMISNFLRS